MSRPKHTLVRICGFLALLLAAGCSSFAVSTPSEPPAAVEGVDITVQIAPFDKPVEITSLQKRITRFREKYPGINVHTDNWQYAPDQIGIRIATNQIATEYNTYASEGRILLQRKWMSDITDLMSRWPHTGELNPVLMKPFTVNGQYSAVPEQGYLMTVTLNKKLFREKGVPLPPLDWTWDEFLEAAVRVSDPERGIAGYVPMTKGNEAGWNWVSFLYAAGGDVAVEADGGIRSALYSEAGLQTLELYRAMKEARVLPTNWVMGYLDAFNHFSLGRGAMIMAGSGDVVDYAVNQGRMKAEELVVYPMPSLAKGGRHTGVFGGNYHVISPYATSGQREWAFSFLTEEMFTETSLQALEEEILDRKRLGQLYVPRLMNYWRPDSVYAGKVQGILDKHENVYRFDPALLRLLDGKEEPLYEAQACYAEIAGVIQDVLTSKTEDPEARLKLASDRLQERVFDQLKGK